jgi:hypothetical protein
MINTEIILNINQFAPIDPESYGIPQTSFFELIFLRLKIFCAIAQTSVVSV